MRRLLDHRPSCGSKKSTYWTSVVRSFKFFVHFALVMLMMFCGAIVFALLEDPEVFQSNNPPNQNVLTNISEISNHSNKSIYSNADYSNIEKSTILGINISQVWEEMESKYNIKLNDDLRSDVKNYLIYEQNKKTALLNIKESEKKKDRSFIFMKWFYFITTSMTTIGYGHVHPHTHNGKMFYIVFSIIGMGIFYIVFSIIGWMGRVLCP